MESAATIDDAHIKMGARFDESVSSMQNSNVRQTIDVKGFGAMSRNLGAAVHELDIYAALKVRLAVFVEETQRFVEAVDFATSAQFAKGCGVLASSSGGNRSLGRRLHRLSTRVTGRRAVCCVDIEGP